MPQIAQNPLAPEAFPRPMGFPQDVAIPPPTPIARPTPLPRRPKGRWFIALVLFGICALAVYTTWDAFFHFQAFGVMTGRDIDVPPPWEGVAQYTYVREGDRVTQGQLLMIVENLEMRQRLAQLSDELRMARANVSAETARLKWQAAFSMDNTRGSLVNYYEMLGQFLQGQSKLEELKRELRRAEILYKAGKNVAISQEELEQRRFAKEGQEQLVAKLREGVAELKKRAEQADVLWKKEADLGKGLAESGHEHIQPLLAKIATLEAEQERLQARLEQGKIRAPVNGIVVKTHRYAGEYCKPSDPVVTLIEEGSLEVVLYMPQKAAELLTIDEEIDVVVDPYAQKLRCTVARFGDQYEIPPGNLERHYWSKEKLLPVYMRPSGGVPERMAMHVGTVVKLPYQLPARWPFLTREEP